MRTEKELQQRREAQRRYRERHPERCKEIQLRSNRKNKERINRYHRNKYDPTRDILRKYRRKFGLTQQQFDEMLISQSGRCAICLVPLDPPCLDHDHATGRSRELLCRFCNLVLGNARDRIIILQKAIEYLKKHGVKDEEAPQIQPYCD
jgi:hypothetical protein